MVLSALECRDFARLFAHDDLGELWETLLSYALQVLCHVRETPGQDQRSFDAYRDQLSTSLEQTTFLLDYAAESLRNLSDDLAEVRGVIPVRLGRRDYSSPREAVCCLVESIHLACWTPWTSNPTLRQARTVSRWRDTGHTAWPVLGIVTLWPLRRPGRRIKGRRIRGSKRRPGGGPIRVEVFPVGRERFAEDLDVFRGQLRLFAGVRLNDLLNRASPSAWKRLPYAALRKRSVVPPPETKEPDWLADAWPAGPPGQRVTQAHGHGLREDRIDDVVAHVGTIIRTVPDGQRRQTAHCTLINRRLNGAGAPRECSAGAAA